MGLELPKRQVPLQGFQLPALRQVPFDQIMAVQSQDPMAEGIKALGDAIAKRAQLREQGQQTAMYAKALDLPTPSEDTTPEEFLKFAATKNAYDKANQEGKKIPLGTPFIKEGKTYQYFYDQKNDKTNAQELTLGVPGTKEPPLSKTFIGNDQNGNPLFADKAGTITKGTVPTGGPVMPKTSTMPTSQARSSAEFATTVLPHIDEFKTIVKAADKLGFIGPLGGRYQDFMTGKIGTVGDSDADYLLGKMKSFRDLLGSATMKAHVGNRGGGDMLDHFLADLDTGKQSMSVLNGELDSLKSFMTGYAGMGKPGLKSMPTPSPKGETPEQRKARLIQEYQGLP